jgi:hypothetical protein
MNAPNASKLSSWLPAVLVTLAAWGVTSLLFNRTSWADWSQTLWLGGDPLEVYARVKIASEQSWSSLVGFTSIDRLGAPFAADWSAYPVPDKPVFALTGRLARVTGLIAAVQLVSAFFLSLNALSFYLTARWLRWRWEWAAALALVFAFCNYNVRWGITLSLGQCFTLPPLVLLCARATRRGAGPIHQGWLALAALLGLWLGLGNPYLAYFAGVVGGGALVLALVRRSPRSRLAPLLVFLGVLTLVFVAVNAAYAWQKWQQPGDRALVRTMDDYRVYALRPADWFVPPADHRLGFPARLGQAYLASRHAAGEFFYNYLGLLGIFGALGLLAGCLRSVQRRRRSALDVPLGLAWIMAFGLADGINTWLGAAGIDLFRAGTRIGIFAVIWFLLLVCGRLHRATRRLARPFSLTLAVVVTTLACWEQTPPLSARGPREKNAAHWEHYRQLTASLEQCLPPAATVFQLPIAPFPEAGRIGTMPDYEHLMPYLTSASLRFSYGWLRPAPVARWARRTAGLPAAALVDELERAGFSALWIDRRGFADEAVKLVADLRQLGLTELPVPTALPVSLFQLHSAVRPVAPDLADLRLQDAWDNDPSHAGPRLFALAGWYDLERDANRHWRWAAQSAQLGIWHDGAATRARLTFAASGRTGTLLRLRLDGRNVWSAALADGPAAPHQVELTLLPGPTVLDWELAGRTFQPGGNDPRRLGFAIENPAVSIP